MKEVPFPAEDCRRIVAVALEEDVGSGDVTSEAVIPPREEAAARIVTRMDCVVAGLPAAEMVFRSVDPSLDFVPGAREGDPAERGTTIAEVRGNGRSILCAERIALNFLQRLSAIATLTARYVTQARPHGAEVLDTRKTIPGWRSLEKYAVAVGGGRNHRFGLFDQILIKENHIGIVARSSAHPVAEAIRRARERHPGLAVEIEVETLREMDEALAAEADIILLDNMEIDEIREAVRRCDGRARLEVSGGVTLENIGAIAATGVDFISVGAITHSPPAVDMSLEMER